METTDQTAGDAPVSTGGELDEIETIVGRAREGTLDEEVAIETIGRIVRRRTPAAGTYQKPWG
ncbi:MAG: hypothetical protein ACXW3O_01530 [Brevundimonas sp.]